jgi:DNA-binding transcriptional ArsR family regulator
MDMRPLFKMHANVCQALANEHRLAIMYSLKEGERRVSDIAEEVGISVHNVSQHLRVLRQALLVRPRKEGQTVYYSIGNPKFMDACSLMRQGLIEQHQAEGESLLWAADFLASVEAASLMSAAEQAAETSGGDEK